MKEAVITIALYAVLIALANTGPIGFVFAATWAAVGCWMVHRSQSRGFLADASFLVTWPIYLVIE